MMKLRTISFYGLIALFTATYAAPIPSPAFAKQLEELVPAADDDQCDRDPPRAVSRKPVEIRIALSTGTYINQSSGVTLSFSPESEKFTEATRQYQTIWNAESKRIIAAMEEVSGMKFQPLDVTVIVFEGPSESGFGDKPMKLRASYSSDTKKATLIHELGHRLNAMIRKRPDGIDEHRVLFLYLYDVWIKLYGKSFADHEVEVEKLRKGRYDYETAWNWALSMSEQERAAKLREIINNNR